jgi:hypothetical protein
MHAGRHCDAGAIGNINTVDGHSGIASARLLGDEAGVSGALVLSLGAK